MLGGNNLYKYASNVMNWVDPLGLKVEWVDPKSINFSQRTISSNDYAEIMKNNSWDWERSPLNVIDMDGQLVTYDNRQLDAAREAKLEKIAINRVDPYSPHPASSKGATWISKFKERFSDRKNVKAGGVVPMKGLAERPKQITKGCA